MDSGGTERGVTTAGADCCLLDACGIGTDLPGADGEGWGTGGNAGNDDGGGGRDSEGATVNATGAATRRGATMGDAGLSLVAACRTLAESDGVDDKCCGTGGNAEKDGGGN